MDNMYNNTKFQIGSQVHTYKYYGSNELSMVHSDRLDFDITNPNPHDIPNPRDRGESRLKFSYNQRPIFEGWFKGIESLNRYATKIIPPKIARAFLDIKDYHMNIGRALRQYV